MGAAVLIRYAFNDRRLMDMYDQIGTPILVEDHKENKFNCSGDSGYFPVIPVIRRAEGYPVKDMDNVYLAMSKANEPVYLVQKYDEPFGGRPADVLTISPVSAKGSELDIDLFRKWCSDILFGTKSAELKTLSSGALNAWVAFAGALKVSPRIMPYNFYQKLSRTANDKMAPECARLDPEGLERTLRIFNGMSNCAANIRLALRLATLDFDRPETIIDDPADILNVLKPMERCKYKTKGYYYLLDNCCTDKKTILEYLGGDQAGYAKLLNLYIKSMRNEDKTSLEMIRPYISKPKDNDELIIAKKAAEIIMNEEKTKNLVVQFHQLYLYSLIGDTGFEDLLRKFYARVRSEQMFRHEVIEEVYGRGNQRMFLDIFRRLGNRAYYEEAALLSGDYGGCCHYVHDLYYLGFMNAKQYKSFQCSESVEYLCGLAYSDFMCSDNNELCQKRVEVFFAGIHGVFGRKIRKAFKKKVVGPIDKNISDAFVSFKGNVKKKIRTMYQIKQFI